MPAPDPARVGCLHPGCDRIAYHRGLCQRHYRQAGNRVGRGETTWAALEAAGACRSARRVWRGPGYTPAGVPADLVAGYESGALTTAEVGRRLSVSRAVARDRLRQAGVDTSLKAVAGRREARARPAPGLSRTAGKLYRGGLTLKQVADRLGLSVAEARGLVTGTGPTGEGSQGG